MAPRPSLLVSAVLLILAAMAMPVPAAARAYPAGHASVIGQTEPPGRVTFTAAPGATMLVQGTYPKVQSSCVDPVQPLLHARFPGTIEVGVDTDGKLFVIGVLPFEEYLKGIAEVPRLWPAAALKAQVVAARSYALANMSYPDETGDRLGYDLCATTSCQVYLGTGVSGGPYGDRWSDAVDDTVGQVLLYKKKPADTLYFSTSNGSTVGNEDVFGTDPLPYLRPVEERDDGASPVRNWQLTIPFDDVSRFLEASGDRSGAIVKSVSRDGDNVVITGGGETTTLPVSQFRSTMNFWAHCLDPDTYPGTNLTNGIGLPQTIPSIWFTMAKSGSSVELTGAGWGHGVGMVQWGAYGKASRGIGYRDILADYYGGLKPKSYDAPATIRIGIAVGLSTVRIEGAGNVTASGTDVAAGPWRLDGGKRVHVKTGSPIPQKIGKGTLLDMPSTLRVSRQVGINVSVPELSVVSTVLEGPDGDVPVTDPVTLSSGNGSIFGTVPDLPPGEYRLVLVVTDGIDIARTNGPKLPVVGGTVPSPTASPSLSASPTATGTPSVTPPPAPTPSGGGSGWVLPVAVIGGGMVVAMAGGLVMALRRRRAKRRETDAWGAL